MKYPLVLQAYNLYHLLGLENYASGEQIKKSYWQLARKYHPDRAESTEKEKQRFILSTAAYNFLRDNKRRHSYEQLLKRKQEKKYVLRVLNLFASGRKIINVSILPAWLLIMISTGLWMNAGGTSLNF